MLSNGPIGSLFWFFIVIPVSLLWGEFTRAEPIVFYNLSLQYTGIPAGESAVSYHAMAIGYLLPFYIDAGVISPCQMVRFLDTP